MTKIVDAVLKFFGVEVSIFYLIAEMTLVVHGAMIMIFVFTLVGKIATFLLKYILMAITGYGLALNIYRILFGRLKLSWL
jgi:hypothetical protein